MDRKPACLLRADKRYLLLHEGAQGVSFYELGAPSHPFGPAAKPE